MTSRSPLRFSIFSKSLVNVSIIEAVTNRKYLSDKQQVYYLNSCNTFLQAHSLYLKLCSSDSILQYIPRAIANRTESSKFPDFVSPKLLEHLFLNCIVMTWSALSQYLSKVLLGFTENAKPWWSIQNCEICKAKLPTKILYIPNEFGEIVGCYSWRKIVYRL